MEEAIRQVDASSYGDINAADSEQGHVLSSEEEGVLKFEEEYHDKIYNRHISDLVMACVGLFGQINQKNSSFASGKPETTVECRKDIAEFVAHMNDTFRCWMAETADLAEKFIHDLNSLFNDYKDRKVMVIDVLEMLIEGLQYVNSRKTERLYIEYGVIESIRGAIEELYDLTEEIREASRRNDDLSLDIAFPFDDTLSIKNYMFPIIREMFPHAQRSLCDQLALSVAIRRRRLRRTFKDAERLRARIARRVRGQANNNQAYPDNIKPSQPSKLQPFNTIVTLPHNIEANSGISIESAFPAKSMQSFARLSTCKYPPELRFPPEATEGICLYCAQRTTPSFLSRRPVIWEFHVNRDIKPFVCLSEQCRSPVLFFASMEQWIEHMNKMHSHEWTGRIHPDSWICNTGHDAVQFKDAEAFREHMNDKESHPTAPDELELRVLEITQWRYLPRDKHLCPLCDITLDMPKRTISTDIAGDDPYWPLHEHIASHLRDLAVLSLPILDTTEPARQLQSRRETQLSKREQERI